MGYEGQWSGPDTFDEWDGTRTGPGAAVERCLAPLGLGEQARWVAPDPRPALRSDLGYRISPRWG